jgi:hypothetical protein
LCFLKSSGGPAIVRIFVEVALVQGLATSMPPLLAQNVDEGVRQARTRRSSIRFPTARKACAACRSAIS